MKTSFVFLVFGLVCLSGKIWSQDLFCDTLFHAENVDSVCAIIESEETFYDPGYRFAFTPVDPDEDPNRPRAAIPLITIPKSGKYSWLLLDMDKNLMHIMYSGWMDEGKYYRYEGGTEDGNIPDGVYQLLELFEGKAKYEKMVLLH